MFYLCNVIVAVINTEINSYNVVLKVFVNTNLTI